MIEDNCSKWEPRDNYIILRPLELPEKTEGGIYIPSQAFRKTNRGIVLKKGENCQDQIPIGAEVFFPQNADWEIEVGTDEKQKIYIVKESDVILWRSCD